MVQKRRTQIVYRAIAVAAAVLIIASVAMNVYLQQQVENTQTTPAIATAGSLIWQNIAEAQTDADIAVFSAQAQEIEDELMALQLAESDNGDGEITRLIDDIETELIEIETIFWEG